MVKVALIGHWGANIGHDIMAMGAEVVIAAAFGEQASVVRLEHHHPLDIYRAGHPLRRATSLRHGRGGRVASVIKDALTTSMASRFFWRQTWAGEVDLAIIPGGPLITSWLHRGDLGLMYLHLPGAFRFRDAPVLNLSVGSAFPLETADQAGLSPAAAQFFARVLDTASVTTVRDAVAERICRAIGRPRELVADMGFMSGRALEKIEIEPQERRYVVLNYQSHGANDDWGQGVDPAVWRQTMQSLVERLQRRHEILLVCHNDVEEQLTQELNPSIPRTRPRTPEDYARIAAGAVAGICSRIHTAIPLASMGVPVIGVGTDTRLGTLEALGIPSFYVKDGTADLLETTLNGLIGNSAAVRQALLERRDVAFDRYVEILRASVGQPGGAASAVV